MLKWQLFGVMKVAFSGAFLCEWGSPKEQHPTVLVLYLLIYLSIYLYK